MKMGKSHNKMSLNKWDIPTECRTVPWKAETLKRIKIQSRGDNLINTSEWHALVKKDLLNPVIHEVEVILSLCET